MFGVPFRVRVQGSSSGFSVLGSGFYGSGSGATPLEASLSNSLRVALGLGRLKVIEKAPDFLHRFRKSRLMVPDYVVSKQPSIDRVAQMVPTLEQ